MFELGMDGHMCYVPTLNNARNQRNKDHIRTNLVNHTLVVELVVVVVVVVV